MTNSNQTIYENAKAITLNGNPPTVHWCGDSLKWSAQCGGCLMWTRDGKDWSSQNEGEFLTPALAVESLLWYASRGVVVDLESLESCDVVNTNPV